MDSYPQPGPRGDVLGTEAVRYRYMCIPARMLAVLQKLCCQLGGAKQEDLEGTAVFGDPESLHRLQRDKVGIGFINIAYAYDLNSKSLIGISQ